MPMLPCSPVRVSRGRPACRNPKLMESARHLLDRSGAAGVVRQLQGMFASMKSKTVILRNKLGLHLRPASRIVKISGKYRSTKVELARDGESVNAKSILGIMTLVAESGAEVEIQCDGPDEEACLDELVDLVNNKFYEE